jgi:hypothetical protein
MLIVNEKRKLPVSKPLKVNPIIYCLLTVVIHYYYIYTLICLV